MDDLFRIIFGLLLRIGLIALLVYMLVIGFVG